MTPDFVGHLQINSSKTYLWLGLFTFKFDQI